MSQHPVPPSWRLPPGINASLWHYAHTERLAEEEDAFFAGHPLFAFDRRTLDERFTEPGPLIDLGCGTGRLALHFARKGFPVAAVEFSRAMLQAVETKASSEGLDVLKVRANLCDLRCLPDRHFQYGLSMFSTLGMIRGARSRRMALAEAFRVLKPGGRLALHAHNVWLNLRDSQGRRWLLDQFARALTGRSEFGDRRMLYRGIPEMEVHLYRWSELRRELRSTGFLLEEVIPIDAVHARPIALRRVFPHLRCGGWIVFARKPA
ncbi:MAG: class I SAM-dependent methyltransferase [Isosphaeraceae bacterium]